MYFDQYSGKSGSDYRAHKKNDRLNNVHLEQFEAQALLIVMIRG
jgi:hypothetical protein